VIDFLLASATSDNLDFAARQMVAKFFRHRRVYLVPSSCVLALLAMAMVFDRGRAQSSKITLISDESSTRAVAFDSVTLRREPFNPTSDFRWGSDNHTRIMIFAMGLDRTAPPSEIGATVQDGANRTRGENREA